MDNLEENKNKVLRLLTEILLSSLLPELKLNTNLDFNNVNVPDRIDN